MTLQSRRCNRRRTRGRWDHVNTTAGLRRRSAARDAVREALVADLPPIDCGPPPGAHWVTVSVTGDYGPLLTVQLYVPLACSVRCDQHPAVINGVVSERMLTATTIGKIVADSIPKRPSHEQLVELRRFAVAYPGDQAPTNP